MSMLGASERIDTRCIITHFPRFVNHFQGVFL